MAKGYGEPEIRQLALGDGQPLYGDGGLVLLKALLQSGVSYLGGYPGAPVAHLMDAMADAYDPVLKPSGVYFEQSANEASAAALFTASQGERVRGAVCWKILGNNVASDALAHHALVGVEGGAMVVVGEDYGLDSTTVPERSLPLALNLGMPVIDPRADLQLVADLVAEGFDLSEHSHLPLMLLMRTRVANLKGSIVCRDNRPPEIGTVRQRIWTKDPLKFPHPVNSRGMDRERATRRLQAATRFIAERGLNEVTDGRRGEIGIITHGVTFNVTLRALSMLGEADEYGGATPSILQLNVVHPLVPAQVADFLRPRRAVLVVEEGTPPVLEDQVRAIAQRFGIAHPIHGKDLLPVTGELDPQNVLPGLVAFLERAGLGERPRRRLNAFERRRAEASGAFELPVVPRTPTFCTGCPERPVFTALKIMEEESGRRPFYANDVGCYFLGIQPPFVMGDANIGMGLGLASSAAIGELSGERPLAFMGDGTFWHSGLTTSVANAVHNRQDAVLVIFENFWTSMTGHHENPATGANLRGDRVEGMSIAAALRAAGVRWIRRVDPYDLKRSLRVLKAACREKAPGLKVVLSTAECMLAKQRRERGPLKTRVAAGRRVVVRKLGVDEDVCTGDHSCVRLNGCPSLTLKPGPNPLRQDPVATIDASCAGCGLCGEVAHAAGLCPSFFEVRIVENPTWLDRLRDGFLRRILARAERRAQAGPVRHGPSRGGPVGDPRC